MFLYAAKKSGLSELQHQAENHRLTLFNVPDMLLLATASLRTSSHNSSFEDVSWVFEDVSWAFEDVSWAFEDVSPSTCDVSPLTFDVSLAFEDVSSAFDDLRPSFDD